MSRCRFPAPPRTFPSRPIPLPSTPSRRFTALLTRAVAISLAAHPFLSPAARASEWINNTGGGIFGGSINWSAGVPGPGQSATFSLATTSLVTFLDNATNASFGLSNGNVTFRSASGPPLMYNVTGTARVFGGSLTLGPGINGQPLTMHVDGLAIEPGSLFITDDNVLSVSTFFLATNDTGEGNLTVDHASLTVAFTALMGLGGNTANATFKNDAIGHFADISMADSNFIDSAAHLTLQTGATVTASNTLTVGTRSLTGQNATILVDGTSSSFTQTGSHSLTLGAAANSSASITLVNGGTFTTGTDNTTINPTGSLLVTNGTYNANGNINVDGGSLQVGAAGTFNLATGKNLTAQNGGNVTFTPAYNIPGGSTFTIQSGAHLTGLNYFDLNDGGAAGIAALIVDGAGSSFTAGGDPWIGATGGSGVLTIRNNATASITSKLEIAVNSNPGTSGTVNVQSGAKLTVDGDIALAAQGGSATGLIHLTDGTLTQTSAGVLTLGTATGANATLLIDNATGAGGTFISSTGGITVHKNASITITRGAFIANGNITVAAGAALSLGGAANAWTGRLELGPNPLILQATANKATTLSTLRNQLAYGTTHPNGITSTTTAADPTHKLTVAIDNALLHLTTFFGTPLDDNSLLIASTWLGDSNLDRKVNVSDLGTLATFYGQPVPNGILQGDFNNDGLVNVTDLGLLATNYGQGTNGAPFSLEADVAALVFDAPLATAVPEPASLLTLSLAALCLHPRRRRRR